MGLSRDGVTVMPQYCWCAKSTGCILAPRSSLWLIPERRHLRLRPVEPYFVCSHLSVQTFGPTPLRVLQRDETLQIKEFTKLRHNYRNADCNLRYQKCRIIQTCGVQQKLLHCIELSKAKIEASKKELTF